MPRSRHSQQSDEVPSRGGKATLRRRSRVAFVAPKRSISAEVRRRVGDCGLRIYLAIQSSLGEPLEPTWPEV